MKRCRCVAEINKGGSRRASTRGKWADARGRMSEWARACTNGAWCGCKIRSATWGLVSIADREQHGVADRVHRPVGADHRRRVRFADAAGQREALRERVAGQIPTIQAAV